MTDSGNAPGSPVLVSQRSPVVSAVLEVIDDAVVTGILSRSLAAQYSAAQETIRQVKDKVLRLESIEEKANSLETSISHSTCPPLPDEKPPRFSSRAKCSVCSARGRRRWRRSGIDSSEKRFTRLEDNVNDVGLRLEAIHATSALRPLTATNGTARACGEFRHECVTPPSPHSRSVDSPNLIEKK
jgi:hypothetical protein